MNIAPSPDSPGPAIGRYHPLMLANAYFLRRGDAFESTELTRGPWDRRLQHAGPAAALIAGAVETPPDAAGMLGAPLTLELLRPLAVGGVLHLSIAAGRTGRRVRGLEATLAEEGRPCVRAAALLVREALVPVGKVRTPPAIRSWADSEPWEFPFFEEP